MHHRFVSFARASRILIVLALFATLLSTASAFYNGQPAGLVLGQANFTSSTLATTASGMNFPYGVAVDPASGKVFIADHSNNRVLRFASGAALVNGAAAEGVLGQPNFTSNTFATTASGMHSPNSVAVDSAGRLWVADSTNIRVLRFDNAASKADGAAAEGVLGQPNFTSNAPATTASGMSNPTGVAVDSAGRLWVAQYSANRVTRFDNAASKANGAPADGVLGQPNFTAGSSTTSASGMSTPSSVAVDSAGRLWVVETFNSRVTRFDNAASKANGAPADGVLGQPNFTSTTIATTASGMQRPTGVTVDSTGRVWVGDTFNNRVLRFDSAASKANGAAADGVLGQPNFTSNGASTTATGMQFPRGVAVDSADRLWVVDSNNHRALRFTDPIAPTVTWANPAAIAYGTALSATQLNATASVPGTFAYTPAAGAMLNVGAGQTLSVLFTPTDAANYSTATKTVTIDVTQAAQTITFAAPAARTYGDAPFAVSATASSGLVVSFASTTPAVCTVSGSTVTLVAAGTCTLTAAQAGNTNYSAAPDVVHSFSVTPAPLAIIADNKIKHVGTANPVLTVNYSGFVNSDDETSLVPPVSLATSAVTGSPVGTYPITPSATLNPNYTISFVTGTLTVTNKLVPVITWANPAAITYGTALGATQLNATANVTGTFAYTPAAGTVLDGGNSQALSVIFTPGDTAAYVTTPATTEIDVLPAPQTITFGALTNKSLGDPAFTLSASSSASLTVSFSSTTPTICTVSGSTVTLLAAGTCTISATQAGDANHAAAPQVAQSFTVLPADTPHSTDFKLYFPFAF